MVLLQPLEPREELPQARDHDQEEEPLQQLAEEEEDDGEGQPLTEGHSAAATVAEELAPEPPTGQHLAEEGLAVALAREVAAGQVLDQALNLSHDAQEGDQREDQAHPVIF